MDSNMSPQMVEYIRMLRGYKRSWVLIEKDLWIDAPTKDVRFFTKKASFVDTLENDLLSSKKVFITWTLNIPGGVGLKNRLLNRFPNLKIEFIYRENREKEHIKRLFMDINNTWSHYNVLMCTPTISSGVSYTQTEYFDMVYGFASQHSCDPYVFFQMFGRVHNPKTNIMKLWNDMKENSTIRYVCNESDVKTELETSMKQIIAKNQIAHLLKFQEEDRQLKRVIDMSGEHWKLYVYNRLYN